ncbi:SMU1112c/YaeR family gloxylase I-like metalloprotein [Alteromonas oceanisediminis]|uniref:SMU1112c/YaeR family gloxylase I-like metalloprotein n=1 Tax=Alteromonas oceanisediminis TaxID=2836180 RepID=UPI001BD9C6BF|nr:VOC family protein [Alteromonas oceanisediminis]MBT0586976.1 VOC family protein [Alteromonas oceanisediminis]
MAIDGIEGIHHVAIICSDYARSKAFYCDVLGCTIIAEHFRQARHSHKLDLAVPGGGQLELFSFPDPPARPSQPEAQGLRHLALRVTDIEKAVAQLVGLGVKVEAIRTDPYTGKRFTFFQDPDGLPLELYSR